MNFLGIRMAILVLGAALPYGFAQTIDLVAGTMDGQAMCAMELDDVTSILGRPAAVDDEDEFMGAVRGPRLFYDHLGLELDFRHGETAGQERVLSLKVYLARTWDDIRLQWYDAFPGTLVPAISADWRLDRTREEFDEFEVVDESPEYQERELENAGVLPALFDAVISYYRLRVGFPGNRQVILNHEKTTRFLEHVIFICPDL